LILKRGRAILRRGFGEKEKSSKSSFPGGGNGRKRAGKTPPSSPEEQSARLGGEAFPSPPKPRSWGTGEKAEGKGKSKKNLSAGVQGGSFQALPGQMVPTTRRGRVLAKTFLGGGREKMTLEREGFGLEYLGRESMPHCFKKGEGKTFC